VTASQEHPSRADSIFPDLPKHWVSRPLKRTITFIEGPGIMASDFVSDGIPLLRISSIGGRMATLDGSDFLSPDLVASKWAHFKVRVADLLISGSASTGLCAEVDDATAGAIPYTGIIIIRPQEGQADRIFLRWFFLSDTFATQVTLAQTGSAIKHFGPTHLSEMFVPLPPISQQRAIADYLDRETGRLDALVVAKERVLGLLAEKRRALITRAVTRGLDLLAPLRDSGIPWLGKIPAHWELVALRFLVDIFGGATPNTGKPELWDGDIPWVSPKDMKRDEIADAEDHVSVEALEGSALRLIDPIAVLIVVRGMILAHSFPTATTTRQVTINQDMKALRCRTSLDPHFLRNFFLGLESHLVSLVDSAAHGTRKLETETLGRFEVCVPPIAEQLAIVEYIADSTARLDNLCAATQRTISLLKERRAALIDAAVTGTLDVQGAVA
jgi:type I restriction enzyme S subunit